jgi:hypothetical protein
MNNQKRSHEDIYNVSSYTDKELYDILDVNNPTDRELEAKLLFLINKYETLQNESGNQLAQFFNEIYKRFFDVSDDENQEEDEEEEGEEGFQNIFKQNIVEGFTGTEEQQTTAKSAATEKAAKIKSNADYAYGATLGYTKTLDYSQDKLNPLLQQTVKRVISIDSQYRENRQSLSTNFTLQLSEPLKDVVSMKLYSIQIPYTWYTISTNYGSNFFYLKGNSPGITNGNHDYMLSISPGNYSPNDLASTIKNSISSMKNTYTDVSFGTTDINYNSFTSLMTTTIDINKQYNETSYKLVFPNISYISPFTSDLSRCQGTTTPNKVPSIGEFLGFANRIYTPYLIKSNLLERFQDTSLNDANTRIYTLTDKNNHFIIYKYIGPNEIDNKLSVIDTSFTVAFSLPTGFNYTRSELISDISNQISINEYLDADYSYIQRFDVSATTFDPSMVGYSNKSFFQLALKLNRMTTKNIPNSKTLVSFSNDASYNAIWYGGSSCFQFNDVSYECNNIISDAPPVKQQSTYYDISTNSPYINLKSIKSGFDLSANNYKITVANSPAYDPGLPGFNKSTSVTGYSLNQYLDAINTGIKNASNGEINYNIYDSTSNSYKLPAIINSDGYFNLYVDINKRINQSKYVLNLSGGILNSVYTKTNPNNIGFFTEFGGGNYKINQRTGVSTSIDIINSLFDLSLNGNYKYIFDISFTFYGSYTFTKKYLASVTGQGESVSNIIRYDIEAPTGSYTRDQLDNIITKQFTEYLDNDGIKIFANTNFTTQPPDSNNVVSATLTLLINKYLTQNDYTIQFLDTRPLFTGINNTSWNYYLHVDPSMTDVSFSLNNNTTTRTVTANNATITNNIFTNLQNQSYKLIGANYFIPQNTITLNDTNNSFKLIPFQDGVSCDYETAELTNANTLTITVPYLNNKNIINYTRDNLISTINNLLTSNPETKGSYIEIKTINGIEYTNIRLTINKVYSAKDYRVVFYDPYSFVKCYVGASSVQNTTWDATLGWILGYRDSVEYVLSEYGSGLDPINIVGDTTVSTNLYNYFLICLDDFNQNHLNDSLVTVTPRDTNIALPSYANPSNITCDPVTGQRSYNTLAVTDYTKLTNNQLYSITEIANSRNTVNPLRNSITSKSYSSGPYVQDVFALIPLRLSGLPNGAYYVDNGGSLQNQQRVYFGPINLSKMSIKLVDDRGNIVNLNNSNWSFSILCEMLYKPKPSG